MKRILLAILILSTSISLKSQIAYYDAITLARQVQNGTFKNSNAAKDTVAGILKNYVRGLQSDATFDDIKAAITTENSQNVDFNPFLKPFLNSGSLQGTTNSGIISKTISSVGSLDVTNIADGIARFLIKRGKEELNTVFFDRLKKFLDDHIECKTLLPATTEFLQNIESYQYAEFIESLRGAFEKDLSNLIVNLNTLIDLPKYRELLAEFPEIRLAIRSVKIVSELSQSEAGILPDSLIHQLSLLSEWDEIHPNLGNSWKLLNIISTSLRYIPGGSVAPDSIVRRWVKLSDLNTLVQNKTTLTIYLGLLYHKVGDLKFINEGDSTKVSTFMAANRTRILFLADLVENFALLANDVDKTIQDFKEKKANKTLINDDYYSYIGKVINITEYGFKVANTIRPGLNADPYIKMARNANELYRNIYTKNYSSAVMNVYQILDQTFNQLEALKEKKKKEVAQYTNNVANIDNVFNTNKDSLPKTKVIEAFLKYGNFIASVAKAENAEEVEKIIEAAALPAGSYSIKQRSSFNVSFNGYIGYAWDFNGKDLYARGIYAPIGFSASIGLSKKHGGALSLFASLLDVGSVASYRLQNGMTDSLKQEIRLESIFSPSLQLMFEVPKTPFVICGGWKRTPKLFYSKQDGFTAFAAKNVFNLSVLIDIPIFTIVNRPFSK